MRQITLKNIRASLTKELNNLPFEITKNGKVIAIVSEKGLNISVVEPEKGLNNDLKSSPNHMIQENPVESVKVQLSDIINEKARFKPLKSTIATGVVPFKSFSKEEQLRKKKR